MRVFLIGITNNKVPYFVVVHLVPNRATSPIWKGGSGGSGSTGGGAGGQDGQRQRSHDKEEDKGNDKGQTREDKGNDKGRAIRRRTGWSSSPEAEPPTMEDV